MSAYGGTVCVWTARGCCKAETDPVQRGVVLLPVARWEWFPRNVARNSRAYISDIEIWLLELQRLLPISKNDRVKLRATFGERGEESRGGARRAEEDTG